MKKIHLFTGTLLVVFGVASLVLSNPVGAELPEVALDNIPLKVSGVVLSKTEYATKKADLHSKLSTKMMTILEIDELRDVLDIESRKCNGKIRFENVNKSFNEIVLDFLETGCSL